MKKLIFVLILLLCLPNIACGGKRTTISYVSEREEDEENVPALLEKEVGGLIYVAIMGCVQKPGVYVLKEGTRLYEAINAAGGFTEDADVQGLNLVEEIKDGTTITVRNSSTADITSEEINLGGIDDGLVDINSANVSQLCTIRGIGEARAKAIIEYREKNGRFSSIEDIMNVSGIKEGTFESIKDYITVR